jgi:tetratricopeptide (TPR) repeat protein
VPDDCGVIGIVDATAGSMRNTMLLAIFVTACAAQGSTRPSPSAGRASTETVEYLIRGDYAGALARVSDGLHRHPDDPWLLYNKGVALAGLGRIDESLNTLRSAENGFTDQHNQSLAAYRRALALEFAGRCGEASTEFSRYAALVRNTEPKLADEALAHLRFCISPTQQQMAEREEVARLAANASDKSRQEAERESTASVEALVVGDYAQALARAEAGLQLAPQDPWLIYNRGTALAGLGRVDESLDALRRAEHLFSTDNLHGRSVATYRRAIALEVAGRCKEEKAELDHYAWLGGFKDPQFAEHERAHVRFCQLANTVF